MRIEDIARIANVSKAAVSLAINGKPGISEEKRKEILALVEEYNYKPLRKTKKKKEEVKNYILRFVACTNKDIIPNDYQNLPYFSELLNDLSTEVNKFPFSLIINSISSSNLEKELQEAESTQPSDAIILLGTNLIEYHLNIVRKIQPNLVIIDTCIPTTDFNFITMNNYQGGYLAAKHIIENNHTVIGYAKGMPRIYNFEEREKGFKDGLRSHHISLNDNYIFTFPAMNIQEFPSIIDQFKQLDPLPSVIFCENDYIAISLIKTLEKLGIDIPGNISVIGFDNIKESEIISPELTTIHVNRNEIISIALQKTFNKLVHNENYSNQTFVNVSLVKRNSFIKYASKKA